MKKWFDKIKTPKFHRYWFYRQYVLSKSLWDDDAEFSAMVGSSLTIIFHSSALLYLITSMINPDFNSNIFSGRSGFQVLLYGLIFLALSYLLLYKDKKWVGIVEEFSTESDKQRKLGIYYLIFYLLFSLLGIFPLVFWINEFILGLRG